MTLEATTYLIQFTIDSQQNDISAEGNHDRLFQMPKATSNLFRFEHFTVPFVRIKLSLVLQYDSLRKVAR